MAGDAPQMEADSAIEPASDAPQGGAPKKSGKGRGRGWRVVFWVALVVFIGALVGLGVIGWTYWSANDRYTQIADEVFQEPEDDTKVTLSDMTVDWDKLESINPDIIGWIYIPGTRINYPVVQGQDNDKYLNTNFDGATGLATGCGTIYLDCNAHKNLTDDNEVIYGHHRNDGTMFAGLSDFADQETFDRCRYVYFLTPKKNYKLKTFSLVRTTGSDPIVSINFSSDKQKCDYIRDKIKRSLVTPKEGFPKVSASMHLFTFATCDYNEDNGRAVLFTRVVKTAVPKKDASSTVGKYVAATE
ncbi:MAG: class B sortase [Eggerthellaceae bacterium]|jgi:sortase B